MEDKIFHLENVSFTFPNGFNIFKDINVDIYKNDVVLVRGESGSGKSTLIKILARFNTIDSGIVEYKGEIFTTWPLLNTVKKFLIFSKTPYYLMKQLGTI